ncbi:hypothetical protein A6E15_07950 [Natrinema saccharevitans]|uniref:DUF1102 domain-containing protein n=1 Tax=Natrinema saccharevitans TaxID=301967 RepID=A0A1S8AVI3_9EURY|nr:hypothetical protein [Natrinema saccharevitans]OLZ40928.1 hypothetical protein A6E15_07950 [Natrinema saccharevitans]
MKRRTVLVGLGALTAGGGVAFGTGAFSRTEAERGVTVSTAVDDTALLRLAPGSGDDGGFVTAESDGTITVKIAEVDNGTSDPGLGVNDGSVTGFPKLIEAENRSERAIEVSATVSPTGGVVLFPDGGFDGPEAIDRLDDPTNYVTIAQGESAELGLALDSGYGTRQIPGTVSDGDSVGLEISATDAEN